MHAAPLTNKISRRIALRRVVVTGIGMVTPLGSGVDYNWSQITAGKSGISKITNFDVLQFVKNHLSDCPWVASGIQFGALDS